MQKVPIGTGRKISDGEDVAILTIGHIGNYVFDTKDQLAEEGINAAHYDMRFIKPFLTKNYCMTYSETIKK